MSEPVPTQRRDRARTHAAILAAAKRVLADSGFHQFGVNQVAREAGCDKQLIYRYFGGIEGLVDAIGTDLAGDLQNAFAALSPQDRPESYGALVQTMVLGLMRILRDNAMIRQISAWEVAAPSPLVDRLVQARSQQLQAWVSEIRGTLQPPTGLDVGAINAVLLASAQQLVLSAMTAGNFSGVAIESDADWQRIESTMAMVIARVYS